MGLIADARDIDMSADAEEQKHAEAIVEKQKRKAKSDDLDDPKEERSDMLDSGWAKLKIEAAAAEKQAWDEEYVKRLKQNAQA